MLLRIRCRGKPKMMKIFEFFIFGLFSPTTFSRNRFHLFGNGSPKKVSVENDPRDLICPTKMQPEFRLVCLPSAILKQTKMTTQHLKYKTNFKKLEEEKIQTTRMKLRSAQQ
jgi:hypothetical protein